MNGPERSGTTIELSDEFFSIGVPLKACKLMINEEVTSSSNNRWPALDKGRVMRMICPRLDRRRSARLLRLQRAMLSAVIGVVTSHCIIGIDSWRIGVGHLTNNFYRTPRDAEEEETLLHLLGTCPALYQRRKRHLCAYYIYNLGYLPTLTLTVSVASL